jgi:hypothetical protein
MQRWLLWYTTQYGIYILPTPAWDMDLCQPTCAQKRAFSGCLQLCKSRQFGHETAFNLQFAKKLGKTTVNCELSGYSAANVQLMGRKMVVNLGSSPPTQSPQCRVAAKEVLKWRSKPSEYMYCMQKPHPPHVIHL